MTARRLRILVLSWHYPTPAAPQRGLWVERMCVAAAREADVTAIVPTPWVPSLMPIEAVSRFRRVPARETREGVQLYFPRVPGSIENLTQSIDARLALPRILAVARELHASAPFDLIHAHFIYPDGVVAARIGRALGIPVMTSEHAFWTPWLNAMPAIGAQVARALPDIALVTAVSDFLRTGIDEFTHGAVATGVLANVVDDAIFFPDDGARDPHEVLFVGLIRRVKRIDVLLDALALLRPTMPRLHLRILSASAFRTYARDRREMHALIGVRGLADAVQIQEGVAPAHVAEAMRRCGLVAVTSDRRETFCSVAAESLACGTPMVITRCGGPEEFVTADDAVMVDVGDPSAFATGMRQLIERRDRYDEAAISARIVGRYGRAAWTEHAMAVYDDVASGVTSIR